MPPRPLRDKIVFVGTTALGTSEVVATPLDTLFAGVEVQATIADNLLEQDFIRRSSLARYSTLQLVVVARSCAVASLVAGIGVIPDVLGGAAGIGGAVGRIGLAAVDARLVRLSAFPDDRRHLRRSR